MQLNLYVPANKQHLLDVLEEVAKATGRPKSEIVLAALEEHLRHLTPPLGRFPLGRVRSIARSELYGERLGR